MRTASVVMTLVVGICLAGLAVACDGESGVVRRVRMEGHSMLPSIDDGTVVDVMGYGAAEPQRGDVVLFKWPKNPNRESIKRIIGLPGDEVEIREEVVHVNDEPLDEPYIMGVNTCPCGPWEVPEGRYFVLGDFRSNSYDSRLAADVFVPEGNIVGWVKE